MARAFIGRKPGLLVGWASAGIVLGSLLAPLAACSSSDDEPTDDGTGGASSSGGQTSTGGQSQAGSGGSTSTGGAAQSGGASGTGGSSGTSTALIGTFQVQLVTANADLGTPASTKIVGKVSDGPTPAAIVWETAEESGGCALRKPRVPFCDPSCGADVCVEDNECLAYPTAKSVGTVTVTGITTGGGASFTIDPVAGNYQPVGVTITYPGFDDQSTLRFQTSGGDFSPFALEAKGIRQLVLTDGDLPLESGKSLALGWTAATSATASSIHVKLDISHHGGTKGMIECDVDDTGSLDVPAALVTKLLALGVAGFPTIVVTRRTTAKEQTAKGVVELDVESPIERSVSIAGLSSCSDDLDCKDGKTCQPDLSCK